MAGSQLITIRKQTHLNLKILASIAGKTMTSYLDELLNKEMETNKEVIENINKLRGSINAKNISITEN